MLGVLGSQNSPSQQRLDHQARNYKVLSVAFRITICSFSCCSNSKHRNHLRQLRWVWVPSGVPKGLQLFETTMRRSLSKGSCFSVSSQICNHPLNPSWLLVVYCLSHTWTPGCKPPLASRQAMSNRQCCSNCCNNNSNSSSNIKTCIHQTAVFRTPSILVQETSQLPPSVLHTLVI